MGWLFTTGQTKEQLVERLIQGKTWDQGKCITVKKALHGNHLWVVFEKTSYNLTTGEEAKKYRFIALFLLAKNKSCDGYGYKDMDEYMGPSYHDCPLSFLEIAPLIEEYDKSGYCKNWRDRVRQYWTELKNKNKHCKTLLATLKVGDRVKIKGCIPDEFIITRMENSVWVEGKKFIEVSCVKTGMYYTIRTKHLKKAEIIPQMTQEEKVAVPV